jgi:Protein of unknown function (DUF3383)
MATIPASAIVNVLPGVISAGGNALVLNGLMLTQTQQRVPAGLVQSFVSAASVGAFFGLTSNEYNKAVIYFNGYTNSTQLPGSLLVATFPQTDLSAWLKSGPINTLTVAQVAAITGSLNLNVDGYTRTVASVNLAAASSYTAAATLLATQLNTGLPTEASATTSTIAAGATTNFTGTISDDVLTVSGTVTGTIVVGGILTGTGVTASTQLVAQLTSTAPGGALGSTGTYAVSISQAVASTTITETYGTLNAVVIASGTISPGQTVTGTGVTAGTVVTAYGTGTGLTGTYIVNFTQTVSSTTLTFSATAITVTYDSVSGSFYFTSGALGAASSVQFATGTAAASLLMTSATAATISPGTNAQTPAVFMAGVTAITQNWASFFNATDPDNGLGNAQKLLFSAWTSTTNNRYAYLCYDTDVNPTITLPATTSLGYLISQAGYSGTCLLYDPTNEGVAAFTAGYIASVNFQAINGRTTSAFRIQSGLLATVTNQQIAANLLGNGYSFIGAYATANQSFTFLYNGQISGPFAWLDSYIDQIYMNAQFQLALMTLLTSINSIPYNNTGYAQIEAALITTIQQMLSFGAIRSGIPLSSNEVTVVNSQAGYRIDDTLTNQGWYVQVQPATPQVRIARTSPVCYFWYTDGQSVQQITLNSLELQ